MNKSLVALTAVALISGAAFASDADPSGQFALQASSQRSRSEVNAEAVAAVQAGETQPSKIPLIGKVQQKLLSSTTRAQVVAEFLADRDAAQALNIEDSGSAYLAKADNVTRANQYLANAR
jgi:hypothetical protein